MADMLKAAGEPVLRLKEKADNYAHNLYELANYVQWMHKNPDALA